MPHTNLQLLDLIEGPGGPFSLNSPRRSVRYIVRDTRKSPEITAVLGAAICKPSLPYVPISDEETRKGLEGGDR